MSYTLDSHIVRARPPGVGPELLRRACEHGDVPWKSTAGLEPHTGVFGQHRAFGAVELAVEMPGNGYNIFATGPAGTGRQAMLREWLGEHAAARQAPPDLVYLCNFDEPLRPHAVQVPAGRAKELATDVTQLLRDARQRIQQAFESDSYRARHRELHDDIDRRKTRAIAQLEAHAAGSDVAIRLTPAGAVTVPMAGGRPLEPDEIRDMPQRARDRYEAAMSKLKDSIEDTFVAMRDLDRELDDRHGALNREVALFAIDRLVTETRRRWQDAPRVLAWLEELRDDAIANLELFRDDGEHQDAVQPAAALRATFAERYAVNVLVSNDPQAGAPVIVATDPSFYDLFGRLEYETAFGAAVTDHRHLRAGLLHRANGGFLVLQALDLLTKPFVWQRLKDVLRTGDLRIENMAVQYMLFPGVSLDPEPAPIHVTVVLVGSAELYDALHAIDDDVARLFKLRADFDDELPRDADGIAAYAALLAGLARERDLPPFDRGAIAAMVEHGSRLAGHRDRLSTSARVLRDVAMEAAHAAVAEGAGAVDGGHVEAALQARLGRSNRIEERIRRSTLEGTIHIDTAGGVAGQVNGLAVALLGDHAFGHPVRITATVGPGEGEVVDIDREARLSGPIHAKGVMILSGYLAGRYFLDRPMTLRASIVFEQSYGPVEGDSASVAELLALLSALARLPVDQGVAVTGAVDQHGNVHAVGGINEKIEGFFDLCAAQGLTGAQGVVIPAANLPHLMLDQRVLDAVQAGEFAVWPVFTVDEALALLTGSDTASELVRARLVQLAQAAQSARAAGRGRPSGHASPDSGSKT